MPARSFGSVVVLIYRSSLFSTSFAIDLVTKIKQNAFDLNSVHVVELRASPCNLSTRIYVG